MSRMTFEQQVHDVLVYLLGPYDEGTDWAANALAHRIAAAIEAAACAVSDEWPSEYAPPADLNFAEQAALTALRGGTPVPGPRT